MEKVKMFNGKMLEIGDKIYFADLWQSDDGDEEELLDSGCVWVANGESDEPIIADFEIIKKAIFPFAYNTYWYFSAYFCLFSLCLF